jgi:chromosome segregation ATPase
MTEVVNEITRLRAELEAAKADIERLFKQASIFNGRFAEDQEQLAAKDAEIEHLRRKLAGACESGLTHMGNAANYRRECVELQDELKAAKARCTRRLEDIALQAERYVSLQSTTHDLMQQIAARDLVIKQLREVLASYRSDVLFRIGSASPYRQVASDYQERIKETLSLQPTTEALDAYVNERLDEMSRAAYPSLYSEESK